MDIHSIFNFVALTNKFRAIKRGIFIKNEDRLENDAEHSYQLAMTAWYLLSEKDYGLNSDLVIQYALVHDFVEVYAGDTSAYRSEIESSNKKKREEESALRLKEEIPKFSDFHKLIGNYEKCIDRESRFVYALDKLIPILNIHLDGGGLWKKHKVTFEDMLENKTPKIAISPEIEPYYKELVAILEENKDMFHVEHDKIDK